MRKTNKKFLGVIGGGQLGRMFAEAAKSLGYKVIVLEPNKNCPASQFADELICADYSNNDALINMSSKCFAVTTEFENVPSSSLEKISKSCFVTPSAKCVSIAQDRLKEKLFFKKNLNQLVSTTLFRSINKIDDIDLLTDDFFPGILKTVRFGYDGKGQKIFKSKNELRRKFVSLKKNNYLIEKILPIAFEISVIAARNKKGEIITYPPAENNHINGILFTSTVPGPHISKNYSDKVKSITIKILDSLDYVGVLCVEFFVLFDGQLIINEMAPRPHNSGHFTIDACKESQFSQQVRTMAGLPFVDISQNSPVVMLNILGNLWFLKGNKKFLEPAWDKILNLEGVKLHLYGKKEPKIGRKMGHINFLGSDLQIIKKRFKSVCEILNLDYKKEWLS
tara:strand:- start:23 stop:1204 length:1182 start_codon:yes stop_codon:yes gene_type:complete